MLRPYVKFPRPRPPRQPRKSFGTSLPRPAARSQEADSDFRPPWVYTWSRLLSYTIIPTVAVYSIFFYDFGDREHVFQPARRWAAQQRALFFTLSPTEQKTLEAHSSEVTETQASPRAQPPTA
ncbi:hypothetical protein BD779DRAFT_736406 [Infundibulicybe gibba]|nr:hypothetical protein BD779DRAFT_736406 [Infundibulicybe gibba]